MLVSKKGVAIRPAAGRIKETVLLSAPRQSTNHIPSYKARDYDVTFSREIKITHQSQERRQRERSKGGMCLHRLRSLGAPPESHGDLDTHNILLAILACARPLQACV